MRIRTTLAATALAAVAVLAGAGTAAAGGAPGATATGIATNSPGFLSGNLTQIPINFENNICGNAIAFLGGAAAQGGNTVCIIG
ncbi:chaplin family protein [Kitasatospora sp. NPDC018058]|uniref:chaplin family protein n=1 Tax=Kitasatospora sp. NPDC018058 TaxID=3364025 RepID=UPI0037BF738C